MKKIILAAGCFWSVQYKLDNLKGVISTKAVYANGHIPDASYNQVCSGETGHAEAVLVNYDESVLPIKDLLLFFFQIHNATQLNKQGPDIGEQYRSGIFCFEEEQCHVAMKIIEELNSQAKYKDKKIVTVVEPVSMFNEAEEYHQQYYRKKGF